MFGLGSTAIIDVDLRLRRAVRRLREAKQEMDAAQHEFDAAERAWNEHQNSRTKGTGTYV